MTTAANAIQLLGLTPHPEGGHYRETWRAPAAPGERSAGTAIYYVLQAGESSHWHRVDADEIWLWHGGGPLALSLSQDGIGIVTRRLGPNLAEAERPQIIVPKHVWQSAKPLSDWTLVSCTVAPAFQFEGFELAPPGWQPTG